MKRINVNQLVIGKSYTVITKYWEINNVIYYGNEVIGNRTYYCFTCGTIENYLNQFNIRAPKSRLKIYE